MLFHVMVTDMEHSWLGSKRIYWRIFRVKNPKVFTILMCFYSHLNAKNDLKWENLNFRIFPYYWFKLKFTNMRWSLASWKYNIFDLTLKGLTWKIPELKTKIYHLQVSMIVNSVYPKSYLRSILPNIKWI